MNTVFNNALKQSTSIRKDLSTLASQQSQAASADPSSDPSNASASQQPPSSTGGLTPAALGSVQASLTAFSRTLDEYATLARQELNSAKQEKAQERVRTFRAELAEYRAQFDSLKAARDEAFHAQNRTELFGRRTFVSATPENPYASSGGGAASTSGAAVGVGMGGLGSGDDMREAHAMREQNFFANTNSALDEYIARGQAVLGDLGSQKEILKSTQKRLYSVANTLGVSGDTIRMIERRALQDKWIFYAGVIVFFLFCWLCLHYLR